LLETSTFIGFSTSSGKKLVHISKETFAPSAGNLRWLFNKLNTPWKSKIMTEVGW